MGLSLFEGATEVGHGAAAAAARGDLPSTARSRQVAPLARVGAYLSLAGMVLGFVGILLPHPQQFDVEALVITQISTAVFAAFFLVFAERIPMWVVRLAPPLGTVQATLSLIFSGDPTSAYVLLYIWPCVYAFYFLPRIDGLINVVFMALCYTTAIFVTDASGVTATEAESLTHHFVLLAGTLVILGVMMHVLRVRVDRLWLRLVGAARTDLVTGLLNNTGAAEIIANEVDRARMGGDRMAILNVTITGMREINARMGHDAGDDLLREISRLLNDSTRSIDTLARTGGTSFTVILPETDENTAFLLAEQILGRLRRTYRERSLSISAGIGVASFPKHAHDAEGLIQAAQSASETAIALGSDRSVVYQQDLQHLHGTDPGQIMADQRTHLTTVLSLAEVLDFRDARFANHSLAVASYCEMIATELGFPKQRVERLRTAALLHDIGKVGLPDSILEKPGPLSPSEWDQVRRHPEMAARILSARELTDIRGWILARHEQLDGHGYPGGLTGDEIPVEARILAVAESYDAMTSERPYRPSKSSDQAIAELGRYAGTQFDGKVVDALVEALRRVGAEQGVR